MKGVVSSIFDFRQRLLFVPRLNMKPKIEDMTPI